MKQASGGGQPRVGIFWLYRGRIFHACSLPLQEAEPYGDCLGLPDGHFQVWKRLKRAGFLERLPVHLRDEYDAIPRGRVVYRRDTGRFLVYHGRACSPAALAKVIAAFHLPVEGTDHEQDPHYNPLPQGFEF